MNPLLSDDAAAWADLVDALRPASLLVLIERRMSVALRARVAPEDVLQEALLRLWSTRKELEWRGPKPLRAYLLKIIENVVRDLADHHGAKKRGEGRHASSLSVEPIGGTGRDLPPALSTTPSRIAMRSEMAAAIRLAVESLPDELSSVVRLRLLEELDSDQVARRLGIGVSAVKHRLRKGLVHYRQALRKHLETQTSEEDRNSSNPGGGIPAPSR